MVISIKMGYQCVLTNLMNNSFQFKYRELRLLVLFLLIILEMHSSESLECAACVCLVGWFFFRKLWVWEKIRSKFVNPWELKNLLWDREKVSENVWHTAKPWELRGLCLYWILRKIYFFGKCDFACQISISCYIIDFIVHVSSYFLQSTLHYSCFIFISFSRQPISFVSPTTVHLVHIYLIWLYSYYMVIQPYCKFHVSANPVSGN